MEESLFPPTEPQSVGSSARKGRKREESGVKAEDTEKNGIVTEFSVRDYSAAPSQLHTHTGPGVLCVS